jgi:hypothetical protein
MGLPGDRAAADARHGGSGALATAGRVSSDSGRAGGGRSLRRKGGRGVWRRKRAVHFGGGRPRTFPEASEVRVARRRPGPALVAGQKSHAHISMLAKSHTWEPADYKRGGGRALPPAVPACISASHHLPSGRGGSRWATSRKKR